MTFPRLALTRLLIGAAGVASTLALSAPALAQAPGGLTQLASPAGCYGAPAGCTATPAQTGGHEIIVSPDGKNVYESHHGNFGAGNSILVFSRDAQTGALTRLAGASGCVADAPSGITAGCTDVRALKNPRKMAFNKTGDTLYVASPFSNAIAVFTRNPDGSLTQKPGLNGCVVDASVTGTEAENCAAGHALLNPEFVAVSPDGNNLYAASTVSDAVATFEITASGNLSEVAGGCVQNVVSSGTGCTDGDAMDGPFNVAVSPDGATVYVGTGVSNSIVALARGASGALTKIPGACVASTATDGCTNLGADVGSVADFAFGAGGAHMYAAMGGNVSRILLFDRNANGTFARRAGTAGCVSHGAATGCRTGAYLDYSHGLELSPDDRHLYVAAWGGGGAVTELIRNADGTLDPRGNAKGCYRSASPIGPCTSAIGVGSPRSAVVSPDGRNVYSTGDFSVAAFRRDANPPDCQDGAATVEAGASIQLDLPCSDADGDAVSVAVIAPPNGGSLGTVDQAQRKVAFTAFTGFSGTTTFVFRGTANDVPSREATFRITVIPAPCRPTAEIPDNNVDEDCNGADAKTPPRPLALPSTVSNSWQAFPRFTRVRALAVNNLPAGSTVVTKCKTKKRSAQKRCPYRSRKRTVTRRTARMDLAKPFRRRNLPLGTVIEISITAPGYVGRVIRYTMRANALPRRTLLCLQPGAKSPSRCT